MQLSKLKCVIHTFSFNDGSRVVWYPIGETDKAHDLFRVAIQFERHGVGTSTCKNVKRPASAAASLHLLKTFLKENKKEE